MIIVMKKNLEESDFEHVLSKLKKFGLSSHISEGVSQTIIGVIGDKSQINKQDFLAMNGVLDVVEVSDPYKLVNRQFKPKDTIFSVKAGEEYIEIGGNKIQIIAGPCAVESREQIFKIAEFLSSKGVKLLRGGAYKPRTSPYSFQGLGLEGLKLLREAADKYNMAVVTEIMEIKDLDAVEQYADIIQIGTRNMYNYRLLSNVGKTNKPVILKRGLSAYLKEFLMSAEYIAKEGNKNIILCERGIRTFETSVRNTFDINAIPYLKEHSHLPVCSDPSHGTGLKTIVGPVARASVAAGTDVIMLEVHNNPEESVSDAAQTLGFDEFESLYNELKGIAKAINRDI